MWLPGHRPSRPLSAVWESLEFSSDQQEWKRVSALPRAPPGGQAWEAPGFLYRRLSEGGCDRPAGSGPQDSPQDSPQLRPFPFLALSSGAAGNERQVQILCWEPVMLPIIHNVPTWGPPAWATPPPPALA